MCLCVCVSGHRTWRYIWHARVVWLVFGRLLGQVILGPAIDFALCASINYLHSLLSICNCDSERDVNCDCDSPAHQWHHGQRLLYRWSQILITLLWPNMVKFQFQAVTRHGRNLVRFTALLQQLFLLLQSLLINSACWVAGSGSDSDGSSAICLWCCCYFCCCCFHWLCCVGFCCCCCCWWRCRRHCACFD